MAVFPLLVLTLILCALRCVRTSPSAPQERDVELPIAEDIQLLWAQYASFIRSLRYAYSPECADIRPTSRWAVMQYPQGAELRRCV
jgi:hypothetical protein